VKTVGHCCLSKKTHFSVKFFEQNVDQNLRIFSPPVFASFGNAGDDVVKHFSADSAQEKSWI